MKPFITNCQLCHASFQFGPHIYRGKVISSYKLTLCDSCYAGNWDGFAPHYEPLLEAHWEKESIPFPARNAKGYYPRGR